MTNKDEDEFEKKFSEIINSDELKEISKTYLNGEQLSLKEFILIQKSLVDALGNVSEVIQCALNPDEQDAMPNAEELEKMGIMYRACEDFNECVADNYIIFTIDENDLEEDDFENGEDEDS